MSAVDATLAESYNRLKQARRRSPAEQDRVRAPDREGEVRAYYEDAVRLPGYRHRPHRCQSLSPVGFCRDNGHPVLGSSSCGTRGCPEHYGTGIDRATSSIVARLAAYRHSREGWDRRLVHAVASPAQGGHWAEDRFWSTRTDAYRALEAAGARGGAAVAHPYRSSAAGDLMFEAATSQGDFEASRGHWAFFRELAGDDWEAMLEYAEPAPHYHALAPAADVDGEAAPGEWIVKNIRSMSRFHIDDDAAYADMARTAYYLLTHAGHAYTEGGYVRASVTWFGELAPSSFDPEAELSPAEWAKIQRKAGEAVAHGDEERICPHEGCESVVLPLEALSTWMDDVEWFRSIGARERNQLRALEVWGIHGVDRPPPNRRRDRERVLTWLAERGAVLTDANRSGMAVDAVGTTLAGPNADF